MLRTNIITTKHYLAITFSLIISLICTAQPSLEYVNFYSEGNPAVYGQTNSLIAITKGGSMYQVGHYNHSVSISGLPSYDNTQVGKNAYIAMYSPEGEGLWSFKLETSDDNISITDIKVDSDDNLVITGRLEGRVDFDPSNGVASVSTPGNHKGFVVKYDSAGNYLWHQHFGSTSWQVEGESIAIDEDNNIYVTGDTGNTLTIGGTSISASAPSLYIARFDSNGVLDWVETYMNVYQYTQERIAISGDKVTVISAFSVHDFDPSSGVNNIQSLGANDILIVQVNKQDGGSLEQDYIRSSGEQYPSKVVGFDDGTYTLLFSSYHPDTNRRSANLYSAAEHRHHFRTFTDSLIITGFDIGANDELYVVMTGIRTVTYNPLTAAIEFSGDPYSYLRKVSPNGNTIWQHKWFATKGQTGLHMHVSDINEIYLSGTFIGQGNFEFNNDNTLFSASRDIDGFALKWKDCESTKGNDSTKGCSPVVHEDQEYYQSGQYILETVSDEGCLDLINLDVEVYGVDSSIVVSNNKITSGQQNNQATFTWVDHNTNEVLNETNNSYSPDQPGQYKFSFETNKNCHFTSSIVTFPEETINRSSPFKTFGEHVHLLGDRIFVNGKYNNTNSIEEYRYSNFGNQISESRFGYSGEKIGEKLIRFRDGILLNSDKNILRYYTRSASDDLEYHSEIIPYTQQATDVQGLGLAITSYHDYLFVGAPLSNYFTVDDQGQSGMVVVQNFINDQWEWVMNITSPNRAIGHKFGEELLIVQGLLFISEPGYENEFGTGQILVYDLENSAGFTNGLNDPIYRLTSNENYQNISSNIYGKNDQLYFRNSNQIFQIAVHNLEGIPTKLLIDGEYEGISNLQGSDGKMAFTTPDSTFNGSYQVHLFNKLENSINHEITFYPYTSNSEFGTTYDLDFEKIVIGAPLYFDGVDEGRFGKVFKYLYENTLTDVHNTAIGTPSFTVFPNPTKGFFNINSDKDEQSEYSYIITDLIGNKLKQTKEHQVDISNLNSGLYILSIIQNDQVVGIQKIIKVD